MSISLLIVDHNAQQRDLLARAFEERHALVRTAATASEARIAYTEHAPDVAIISLPLGDSHQNSLPWVLLDANPHVGLILLVESGTSSAFADAIYRGAFCLERPVKFEGVVEIAERAKKNSRTRAELTLRRRDHRSPAPLPSGVDMLIDLAARNVDAPVLITGEPGTGKSIVARLVHDLSERSGAPFLDVDCSHSDAAELVRSLFGSERGASQESPEGLTGIMEIADRGSVLLKIIENLSLASQESLLRLVEEKEFVRQGGSVTLQSGARIFATSRVPLANLAEGGLFRADLFYRLQMLTVSLPPLRERINDITRLASAMLPPDVGLAPSALLALQQHDWPGNVRELENVLWRAALQSRNGTIELRHLALTATLEPLHSDPGEAASPRPTPVRLADMERRAILTALESTGGNKLRAAALLGIARSTLHDKLRRL